MVAVAVLVQGLRHSPQFQRARYAAEALREQQCRDYTVSIQDMNENDWVAQQTNLKREQTGASSFQEDVAALVDGKVHASVSDFVQWVCERTSLEDKPDEFFEQVAKEQELAYRASSGHDFVFFDVHFEEGDKTHRIVFELFRDKLPRTCDNFKQLCEGSAESTTDAGRTLTYKDSLFHRIQPLGWAQGGDIIAGHGDQGESVYGATFEDETFQVEHSKRGMLAMANNGLHSNASQFFISFRAMPWMNTKYVAFGCVYRGSAAIDALEGQKTYNQRPVKQCTVRECGVYPQDEV
jgi:peptidyl-prolyl cis-trans isomerase-like 6